MTAEMDPPSWLVEALGRPWDPKIDISADRIFPLSFAVWDCVGKDWVNRRLAKAEALKRKRKSEMEAGGIAYLIDSDKQHPLIQLIEIQVRSAKEALITKRRPINDEILQLAVLGRHLEQAKGCKGVERVLPRLRVAREFHGAAFELEVASAYLNDGYEVEFVEEVIGQRTPDLFVKAAGGKSFWVECKSSDGESQRDVKISACRDRLFLAVNKTLFQKGQNFAVLIKALGEPLDSEVAALAKFIFAGAEAGGLGKLNADGSCTYAIDPSGKYEVAVHRLAKTGESLRNDPFDNGLVQKLNHGYVCCGYTLESFLYLPATYTNPTLFAFETARRPDAVGTIMHSFKAATPQLPPSGPGVIWIRIRNNRWSDDYTGNFNRAQALLKRALQGEYNRRVNAVLVLTRYSTRHSIADPDGASNGMIYRHAKMCVEHSNPRSR